MSRVSRRRADRLALILAVVSAALLAALFLSLRMGAVTGHLASRLVKDPERTPPPGRNITAPADGTVLYVKRFAGGKVPMVIKKRTPIPIADFLHAGKADVPDSGVLIGIYMNTFGVHVNRIPLTGTVRSRHWYNGPHMDMTKLEKRDILAGMIPSPVFLKKLFGLAPYQIYQNADYITKSARETLVVDGDFRCRIVRIADFHVGRILTWVRPGDAVKKGQRLGFITWGSQTDILIETPGPSALELRVRPGDYVYGGETILADY